MINSLFDMRVENYEQNPGYEDEDDAITDQPSHGPGFPFGSQEAVSERDTYQQKPNNPREQRNDFKHTLTFPLVFE